MQSFAKLSGAWVQSLRFFPSRKARASAQAPAIFSQELNDTIESAVVSMREAGEGGPRVMVISNALRGAFIFSRQEAARRIREAFPELSDTVVMRGVNYLETRARMAATPTPGVSLKGSWVHGWMER